MKRLLYGNASANGEIDTDVFTQAILQFRNTLYTIKPKTQVFNHNEIRPLWRDWFQREDTLRTRFAKQIETLSSKTKKLATSSVW